MGDVKLPSLPTSIENMTRDSLRSFIPQLICQTEKRESVEFKDKEKKPVWWPVYTPWASLRTDTRDPDSKNRTSWSEELRNIVRCCYRFHQAEHMLHESSSPTSGSCSPQDTGESMQIVGGSEFHGKVPASLEAKIPMTPPVCEEADLSPLPKYYTPTGDVPEESAALGPTQPAQKSQSNVRVSMRLERKREDEIHEIFICCYCHIQFKTKPDLTRHQSNCIKSPSNIRGTPKFQIGPHPTAIVEQIHVDLMARARKVDITERLGLLPISKAKSVRKQRSRVREIQITKLDDGEKTHALKSPQTPRSAKSLISQLSREFSPPAKSRRKSLFSASLSDQEESEKCIPKDGKEKEASDSESVSSKSSEKVADDGPKDPWNKEKKTSILTIDFSSPLGIRASALMAQQAEKIRIYTEEPTTNYEDFCHTPKKTGEIRRLRDRKDLITFRKNNRRVCPKWAHSYKFTRADREEWYRTIRTGLNARSRPLRKLLKPCSVKIKRLTKEEIAKWTTRKPRPSYMDLSLLKNMSMQQIHNLLRQQNIPDYQKRMIYNSVLSEMQPRAVPFMGTNASGVPMIRSVQGAFPVPNGMFTNMNNRPGTSSSSGSKNIARNVAQSVVRNLQNQMNHNGSPGNYTFHNGNMIRNGQNVYKTSPGGFNINGGLKRAMPTVVRKPKTSTKNPIVIDDEDDDDVTMVGSTPPPRKKQRIQPSEQDTSLLFKCHLCGEELTCIGSFAKYIEQHFADKHNVRTIQLIEHIDQSGQKVVSIVEKQVANAPPPPRSLHQNRVPVRTTNQMLTNKPSASTSKLTPNNAKPFKRSTSPKARQKIMKNSDVGRDLPAVGKQNQRKSNRSQPDISSPPPVICID